MNKELNKLEKEFNKNRKSPPKKSRGSSLDLLNKILIAVSILIVITGIYFLFFYQAPIQVEVNPKEASIALDKREVSNEFSARPGEHQLVIAQDGYLTYSQTINVDYFSNELIRVNLQKEPELKKLDSGEIKYLSYDSDKETLFYLKDRACWRLDLRKEKLSPERISPYIFKNISNLIWTKSHLGVIAQADNPRELRGTKFFKETNNTVTFFYDFMRYDLLNQVAKYWGKGIGEITINPNKDRVAYYYSTLEPESSLVISDINRNNVRRVARISDFDNPEISWNPGKEYILIYNEDQLSTYDSYLDQLRTVGANLNIFWATTSPDSKKILYLNNSPEIEKPASLMNTEGEEKTNLNFNILPSNLDWIETNQYIALGKLEGKPRAFKYNIDNGNLLELAWPEEPTSRVSEIEINSNSDKIYLVKENNLMELEIVNKNY